MKKLQLFDQHHGLTLLEKCQFCGCLNRRVRCSVRLVCYRKRRKSFFLDLFSGSMTWEYRGYRGLKGLQGVTGGDKGLQWVTRGYRGLRGVKWGYGGLQRTIETFF